MTFDCIVMGGGPAGLSAALVLGRCRRSVAVIDAGRPRNPGHAAHGIFTRDGEDPHELRRIARRQLAPYDVRLFDDEVVAVRHDPSAALFHISTWRGQTLESKKLLLATGMRDRMPDEAPFRERLGRGVFVCPHCDGWERRDKKLAAYAPAATGAELALALRTWSADVVLIARDGIVPPDDRARLSRNGVPLHEDVVTSLRTTGDELEGLALRSGVSLDVDAIFVQFGSEQASPFAAQLGCTFDEKCKVCPKEGERGEVPGLFVAGDASHDLQLYTIAVAEGVKAACAMNAELRKESEK